MKISTRSCRWTPQRRGLASASLKRKDTETLDSYGERAGVETFSGWQGKAVALQDLKHDYPTVAWLGWKLSRQPHSFWENLENRRSFMDWLFLELKLKDKEDLYQAISTRHFQANGANELYQLYNSSLYDLLQSVYPDTNWIPWKFHSHRLTWEMGQQQSFMCWLGTLLDFQTQEDWYRLTKNNISKNYGLTLLSKYGHSPSSIVETVYSQFLWKTWFFHPLPPEIWDSMDERREYLDWLGLQLGIKTASDWYGVVSSDFTELHGGSLLIHVRKEGNDWSLIRVLKDAYPWYQWEGWRFVSTSHEFWDKKHNKEDYLAWLSHVKGITEYQQWYKVSIADFNKYQGRGILRTFGNSPSRLLRGVYPDLQWDAWRFEPTPKDFWNTAENRKLFFDRFAEEYGIDTSDPNNWYSLTPQRMTEFGGEGLLRMYNNSPYQALCAAFPDLHLHPWKFQEGPAGAWTKDPETASLVEDIEKKQNIKNKAGWESVTLEVLEDIDCLHAVNKAGGLAFLLDKFFPHAAWDYARIEKEGRRAGLKWVHSYLTKLFPDQSIITGYVHPTVHVSPEEQLILDFYLPELSLAFEYEAYKRPTTLFSTSISFLSTRKPVVVSKKKEILGTLKELTVVEVPYWWNGDEGQLIATIRKQKPTLLEAYKEITTRPIPLSP